MLISCKGTLNPLTWLNPPRMRLWKCPDILMRWLRIMTLVMLSMKFLLPQITF